MSEYRINFIKISFIIILVFNLNYAQTSVIDESGNNIANPDEIVARVNDFKITAEEFKKGYEYSPAFIRRGPDSKQKYLKYLINEKLLSIKGRELDLDSTELASEMYDAIKDDLATEELFKEDILKNLSISEKEIDTTVSRKQLELQIKWLYSQNSEDIRSYLKKLSDGVSFDSLYNSQLSEDVFNDMRSMNTTRYQLGIKNHLLAGIIDTLKVGTVSAPIHTPDGWYIVKLENVSRNLITNETEYQKLKYEAKQAITKIKMDEASEKYVNKMMESEKPVIGKEAFAIFRSYLGQFVLTKEKYDEWNLSGELKNALEKYSDQKDYNYNSLTLVAMSTGSISIERCLIWFRNRAQYIKFNKNDLASFSNSVKQMIWRMVRDELLTIEAKKRRLYDKEIVKKQAGWWKDKIVFSALLNEYKKSIEMSTEEIRVNDDASANTEVERENTELSKKLFYEIAELKKRFPVNINNDVLNNISVSDENNPHAIELYAVKKGGLIPRTPYPTIDNIWALWE